MCVWCAYVISACQKKKRKNSVSCWQISWMSYYPSVQLLIIVPLFWDVNNWRISSVHIFLAREARALRSLFFFFFWTQSPKFVDFWHFCNLFCLSMIKVQFYNVFWNFFLKLCSFFKRFLFLQKFSILHSHLLSFQMKFNTPYVLPNFGIQSIIFQNFQVFSKHLYLLLLKSILSKIFAAILLCFLK